MKREYMKPAMRVVRIHQTQMLCGSVRSLGTNMTGDDAIDYGGGSNGPARARSHGDIDWDDWDEE